MSHVSHNAYTSNQYGSMSPERLILALLDAALTATTRASIAVEEGDVPGRGQAVSKALAIVGELQSSLDLDAGELAQNLFALYDYAQRELLSGNMNADAACFSNAERVLSEIHAGWDAMLGAANQDVQAAEYA